ncbi:MAG: D-sedoheptulose-7-phosphate isomerase [Pseudomonadota bacterium]
MEPESAVRDMISSHIDAAAGVLETQTTGLLTAAERLVRCLLEEGRIFSCGNGGSAANAQQFAAKLLGRLERERPALPVFCLAENAALATSLAGHYGAADMFARQLRALGRHGDILIAISASGMSANTVQAVLAAHDRGMTAIVLTGHDGGDIARVLGNDDLEIRVPTVSTARTEEIHLLLLNVLCDLLERELFGDTP